MDPFTMFASRALSAERVETSARRHGWAEETPFSAVRRGRLLLLTVLALLRAR